MTGAKAIEAFRRVVLLRTVKGTVAFTANRVFGVTSLPGVFNRMGSSGIQKHLRGPATTPSGEASVIETETNIDFLASGG
jgi:purine-binding chemotaxis protein CheW